MASKETFTQHLAHEMAQVVVHRERYGWPPDSPWGMFQPTRPEEMKKPAAKEDHYKHSRNSHVKRRVIFCRKNSDIALNTS